MMPDGQDSGVTQMTTEYGVRVAETAPHISFRRTYRYWTPASSPEEALEIAADHWDEVISDVDDVEEQTVPAPEGWNDAE